MSDHSLATLHSYVDYLRVCGRSPHTIALRKMQVRALLEAHPDPWRTTTEALTDWLGSHCHWSRATSSSYRDGLRGFFGWLVDTPGRGSLCKHPSPLKMGSNLRWRCIVSAKWYCQKCGAICRLSQERQWLCPVCSTRKVSSIKEYDNGPSGTDLSGEGSSALRDQRHSP